MQTPKKKDDIAKALGLSTITTGTSENTQVQVYVPAPSSNNDFEYVRTNLHNLIQIGTGSLKEIVDVASQSQHPRAFEVVATMIKTLVDANKDLVQIIKDDKEIKKDSEAPTTVNNNLIMTTADLLEKIKSAKKQNEEDKQSE